MPFPENNTRATHQNQDKANNSYRGIISHYTQPIHKVLMLGLHLGGANLDLEVVLLQAEGDLVGVVRLEVRYSVGAHLQAGLYIPHFKDMTLKNVNYYGSILLKKTFMSA